MSKLPADANFADVPFNSLQIFLNQGLYGHRQPWAGSYEDDGQFVGLLCQSVSQSFSGLSLLVLCTHVSMYLAPTQKH